MKRYLVDVVKEHDLRADPVKHNQTILPGIWVVWTKDGSRISDDIWACDDYRVFAASGNDTVYVKRRD